MTWLAAFLNWLSRVFRPPTPAGALSAGSSTVLAGSTLVLAGGNSWQS